jgi:hypothetical protein
VPQLTEINALKRHILLANLNKPTPKQTPQTPPKQHKTKPKRNQKKPRTSVKQNL